MSSAATAGLRGPEAVVGEDAEPSGGSLGLPCGSVSVSTVRDGP
ncbi:hypothetical protein [Ideonella paludis]